MAEHHARKEARQAADSDGEPRDEKRPAARRNRNEEPAEAREVVTTNRDVWESSYRYYTEDLTKHGRRLGFVGFGVAWLLRVDHFVFPFLVLCGLGLLMLFFVLDVTQGWVAAVRNRRWIEGLEAEYQEKMGTILGDYTARPRNLDRPVRGMWHAKLAVLLGAYGCVALEVVRRVVGD